MTHIPKSTIYAAIIVSCSFVTAAVTVKADESDEKLWKKLDITQDGWLDGTELKGGWSAFDTDGDKEVTKAEFMAGRAKERNAATPKDLAQDAASVFKRLDTSGNGYLTGTELDGENALSLDVNNDKVVTLEEFTAGYTGPKPLATKNLTGTIKQQKATPSSQKPDRTHVPSKTNLASSAVQPVPAKMINGKPEGLYYMQKYWIATRYLEKSCWYFAPDGTFYENLTEGFSPQDLKDHKGLKGSYKANKGNLEVTWSNGNTSKGELEIVPGGFNWDTGMFLPVEPLASGKKVDGLYEGGTSFGTSYGGGGNSTIVSKTLRLDADGTYAMSGVASLQSTDGVSQAKVGGQSQVDGKWKLDGYILFLTNADGTSARHVILPFYDQANPAYPERLFVGGTVYKRK